MQRKLKWFTSGSLQVEGTTFKTKQNITKKCTKPTYLYLLSRLCFRDVCCGCGVCNGSSVCSVCYGTSAYNVYPHNMQRLWHLQCVPAHRHNVYTIEPPVVARCTCNNSTAPIIISPVCAKLNLVSSRMPEYQENS